MELFAIVEQLNQVIILAILKLTPINGYNLMIVKSLFSTHQISSPNVLGDILHPVPLMMTTMSKKNNHPKAHTFYSIKKLAKIQYNYC